MITYKIAKQYTEIPGPRFKKEGEFSGEDFRETVLKVLVRQAQQASEKILIDLDGGYGYPTSFLEEAFGGLIRELKDKELNNIFEFKSDEEPLLIGEIKKYIQEAMEKIK